MTWPQDWQTNVLFLLRWGHFLAGITWIGLLYFFNLVNVGFMKELDAASKGKVVPNLMPKALWWFRWGAVWTLVFGFTYYLFLLGTEKITGRVIVFLVAWTVAWLIVAALLRMSVAGGPLKDGRVLAVAIAVLVLLVSWGAVSYMRTGGSNRTVAIAIGGGMGYVMFMNVWMIIWPLQQKIIAATKATAETGAPAPADMPKWARRAFLASRTNAWLSVPMLFFMGAASHFPIFGTVPQ
ncbi:MAG TPA: urate hydroxylase PuuD [Thermoanaerobaculia bacterium]|nr:urate hydroxylase PuuD [Thermoanaerobaculia bacterium]